MMSARRPGPVLFAAGVLYLAVFAMRMFTGDAVDAYSMFYVLPVALLATSFGLRGGLDAGLLAIALIAVWAVVRDVSLGPTGWASRVVPLMLLGVLLGEASDRERRTATLYAFAREVAAAAMLHREAIEINDSLVQGMAAAKWALEAGQVDAGLQTLTETITRAHELVSVLIRQAGMGGHTEKLPTRK